MRIEKNLEGDRIYIRNYEVEDKLFCTSMWFDEENGKYLSDPTREYVDDVFQNAIDTLQESEDGYYLVISFISNDENVGTCCIFPDETGTCIDIGYCIDKKYWRSGYATEALQQIIAWSGKQGFSTITAEVAKDNEASCRLLNKLGFGVKTETRFKKYHMEIEYQSYIFE